MSLKNALQDTTQASHAARRNTTHQLGGTVLIRLEMSISFLILWLLQRHDGEESWLLISLAEPLQNRVFHAPRNEDLGKQTKDSNHKAFSTS